MMEVPQAIILGLIQGLTEFLPVSSSGHLILARALFGWEDVGLATDAVLHLGTLGALFVVYWRTVVSLRPAERRALLAALLAGTLPAAVVGVGAAPLIETTFRTPARVGGGFLVLALFLALADWRAKRPSGAATLGEGRIAVRTAFLVGLAQAVALLPGVSRSGATIGAGILLGLPRPRAVEFSFLLAGPILFGAGVAGIPAAAARTESLLPLAVGVLVAFAVSLGTLRWFLRYVRGRSFLPFVLYLAVAGVLLVLRA